MKRFLSILLIVFFLSSCMLDYPAKQLPEIEYCGGCETTVSYDENGVRSEQTSCPGHVVANENLKETL